MINETNAVIDKLWQDISPPGFTFLNNADLGAKEATFYDRHWKAMVVDPSLRPEIQGYWWFVDDENDGYPHHTDIAESLLYPEHDEPEGMPYDDYDAWFGEGYGHGQGFWFYPHKPECQAAFAPLEDAIIAANQRTASELPWQIVELSDDDIDGTDEEDRWSYDRRPVVAAPEQRIVYVGPRGEHHSPIHQYIMEHHGYEEPRTNNSIIVGPEHTNANDPVWRQYGFYSAWGGLPEGMKEALLDHYQIPDNSSRTGKTSAAPTVHLVEPQFNDHDYYEPKSWPFVYYPERNQVYLIPSSDYHSTIFEDTDDYDGQRLRIVPQTGEPSSSYVGRFYELPSEVQHEVAAVAMDEYKQQHTAAGWGDPYSRKFIQNADGSITWAIDKDPWFSGDYHHGDMRGVEHSINSGGIFFEDSATQYPWVEGSIKANTCMSWAEPNEQLVRGIQQTYPQIKGFVSRFGSDANRFGASSVTVVPTTDTSHNGYGYPVLYDEASNRAWIGSSEAGHFALYQDSPELLEEMDTTLADEIRLRINKDGSPYISEFTDYTPRFDALPPEIQQEVSQKAREISGYSKTATATPKVTVIPTVNNDHAGVAGGWPLLYDPTTNHAYLGDTIAYHFQLFEQAGSPVDPRDIYEWPPSMPQDDPTTGEPWVKMGYGQLWNNEGLRRSRIARDEVSRVIKDQYHQAYAKAAGNPLSIVRVPTPEWQHSGEGIPFLYDQSRNTAYMATTAARYHDPIYEWMMDNGMYDENGSYKHGRWYHPGVASFYGVRKPGDEWKDEISAAIDKHMTQSKSANSPDVEVVPTRWNGHGDGWPVVYLPEHNRAYVGISSAGHADIYEANPGLYDDGSSPIWHSRYDPATGMPNAYWSAITPPELHDEVSRVIKEQYGRKTAGRYANRWILLDDGRILFNNGEDITHWNMCTRLLGADAGDLAITKAPSGGEWSLRTDNSVDAWFSWFSLDSSMDKLRSRVENEVSMSLYKRMAQTTAKASPSVNSSMRYTLGIPLFLQNGTYSAKPTVILRTASDIVWRWVYMPRLNTVSVWNASEGSHYTYTKRQGWYDVWSNDYGKNYGGYIMSDGRITEEYNDQRTPEVIKAEVLSLLEQGGGTTTEMGPIGHRGGKGSPEIDGDNESFDILPVKELWPREPQSWMKWIIYNGTLYTFPGVESGRQLHHADIFEMLKWKETPAGQLEAGGEISNNAYWEVGWSTDLLPQSIIEQIWNEYYSPSESLSQEASSEIRVSNESFDILYHLAPVSQRNAIAVGGLNAAIPERWGPDAGVNPKGVYLLPHDQIPFRRNLIESVNGEPCDLWEVRDANVVPDNGMANSYYSIEDIPPTNLSLIQPASPEIRGSNESFDILPNFIHVPGKVTGSEWSDGRIPVVVVPQANSVYYSDPGQHHFRAIEKATEQAYDLNHRYMTENLWPEYGKGHFDNHPELQPYMDALMNHLGIQKQASDIPHIVVIPNTPGQAADLPFIWAEENNTIYVLQNPGHHSEIYEYLLEEPIGVDDGAYEMIEGELQDTIMGLRVEFRCLRNQIPPQLEAWAKQRFPGVTLKAYVDPEDSDAVDPYVRWSTDFNRAYGKIATDDEILRSNGDWPDSLGWKFSWIYIPDTDKLIMKNRSGTNHASLWDDYESPSYDYPLAIYGLVLKDFNNDEDEDVVIYEDYSDWGRGRSDIQVKAADAKAIQRVAEQLTAWGYNVLPIENFTKETKTAMLPLSEPRFPARRFVWSALQELPEVGPLIGSNAPPVHKQLFNAMESRFDDPMQMWSGRLVGGWLEYDPQSASYSLSPIPSDGSNWQELQPQEQQQMKQSLNKWAASQNIKLAMTGVWRWLWSPRSKTVAVWEMNRGLHYSLAYEYGMAADYENGICWGGYVDVRDPGSKSVTENYAGIKQLPPDLIAEILALVNQDGGESVWNGPKKETKLASYYDRWLWDPKSGKLVVYNSEFPLDDWDDSNIEHPEHGDLAYLFGMPSLYDGAMYGGYIQERRDEGWVPTENYMGDMPEGIQPTILKLFQAGGGETTWKPKVASLLPVKPYDPYDDPDVTEHAWIWDGASLYYLTDPGNHWEIYERYPQFTDEDYGNGDTLEGDYDSATRQIILYDYGAPIQNKESLLAHLKTAFPQAKNIDALSFRNETKLAAGNWQWVGAWIYGPYIGLLTGRDYHYEYFDESNIPEDGNYISGWLFLNDRTGKYYATLASVEFGGNLDLARDAEKELRSVYGPNTVLGPPEPGMLQNEEPSLPATEYYYGKTAWYRRNETLSNDPDQTQKYYYVRGTPISIWSDSEFSNRPVENFPGEKVVDDEVADYWAHSDEFESRGLPWVDDRSPTSFGLVYGGKFLSPHQRDPEITNEELDQAFGRKMNHGYYEREGRLSSDLRITPVDYEVKGTYGNGGMDRRPVIWLPENKNVLIGPPNSSHYETLENHFGPDWYDSVDQAGFGGFYQSKNLNDTLSNNRYIHFAGPMLPERARAQLKFSALDYTIIAHPEEKGAHDITYNNGAPTIPYVVFPDKRILIGGPGAYHYQLYQYVPEEHDTAYSIGADEGRISLNGQSFQYGEPNEAVKEVLRNYLRSEGAEMKISGPMDYRVIHVPGEGPNWEPYGGKYWWSGIFEPNSNTLFIGSQTLHHTEVQEHMGDLLGVKSWDLNLTYVTWYPADLSSFFEARPDLKKDIDSGRIVPGGVKVSGHQVSEFQKDWLRANNPYIEGIPAATSKLAWTDLDQQQPDEINKFVYKRGRPIFFWSDREYQGPGGDTQSHYQVRENLGLNDLPFDDPNDLAYGIVYNDGVMYWHKGDEVTNEEVFGRPMKEYPKYEIDEMKMGHESKTSALIPVDHYEEPEEYQTDHAWIWTGQDLYYLVKPGNHWQIYETYPKLIDTEGNTEGDYNQGSIFVYNYGLPVQNVAGLRKALLQAFPGADTKRLDALTTAKVARKITLITTNPYKPVTTSPVIFNRDTGQLYMNPNGGEAGHYTLYDKMDELGHDFPENEIHGYYLYKPWGAATIKKYYWYDNYSYKPATDLEQGQIDTAIQTLTGDRKQPEWL